MIFKCVLVIAALALGTMCRAPDPLFDSCGPNQLFVYEGEAVKTVSGAEFLTGVSVKRCATVCNWMDRQTYGDQNNQCQCCNSFSYRASDSTCYLKKRDPDLSISCDDSAAVQTSNQGWQSYKFWDYTLLPYTGGLPDTVFGWSLGARVGVPYEVAYISMGKNKIAKKEGKSIKTSQGFDRLTNTSPKKCAQECNAITQCDGFSYNPRQNQGTCFLKTNSQQKYETVYNSNGWTYYWKEMDWRGKCFCPCKTPEICIMCDLDNAVCDAL